ncbi:hypothetical protein FRX31_015266 [Thalictrum thalictroides]|uniref:Uncharacterized protein n=1 Tax=Thalictrum thalictroides TaxID=46969 RepID=A0A7J6WE08_THATH|nr:hypothetical protein FRX31_015266 [Thalictrum thalictroides]
MAPEEWIWICHLLRGTSLNKLLLQFALVDTMYWLWMERNQIMYGIFEENRPLFQLITSLNADGSLTETSAGYGGIIRDDKDNVILAYTARSSVRFILFLEMTKIAKGVEATMALGNLNYLTMVVIHFYRTSFRNLRD